MSSTPKDVTPARRGNAGLAWLVSLVIATGAISAFYAARSQLGDEKTAHTETRVELDTSREELEALQAKAKVLEEENAKLLAAAARLNDETLRLAEETRLKEEALAGMQATRDELEARLQKEIALGDVRVSEQQGELVVDLIDRVVFDSGEAELNEQGQQVLRQVGETLAKVEDRLIVVSGHTDNLKISEKLAERFPSNWELSTARATHVVRFLQDEVKLPGKRLMAAGLAEYKPVASNRTVTGRKRNRRIEVKLMPLPGKEATATAAR